MLEVDGISLESIINELVFEIGKLGGGKSKTTLLYELKDYIETFKRKHLENTSFDNLKDKNNMFEMARRNLLERSRIISQNIILRDIPEEFRI